MNLKLSAVRNLYKSFVRFDNNNRWNRIRREIWCFKSLRFHAAITADFSIESSQMEREARDAFVNGHFISAHILAVSFCEHTLSDWLLTSGVLPEIAKRQKKLSEIAHAAQAAGVFDDVFWDNFRTQREIRNAYVHRSWDRNPSGRSVAKLNPQSLTSRFKKLKTHPSKLMELDAQNALLLMDKVRHLRHSSGITKNPFEQ